MFSGFPGKMNKYYGLLAKKILILKQLGKADRG